MKEKIQEWLKMVGVCLVVFGHIVLSLAGLSFSQRKQILSNECEDWLIEHDEFTVPPGNCKEQIEYLNRRLDKESEEHGWH